MQENVVANITQHTASWAQITEAFSNCAAVVCLLLKVLLVRLHHPPFSHFHLTLVPVSSIPIFPLTRTSDVVPTVQALCFHCRLILRQDCQNWSMRMTCFVDSWRRSERWTASLSSAHGVCQSQMKSQLFSGETGRGHGVVERSWNSFVRRIKIWSSVFVNRPTNWWNWNRNERVYWWPLNCCRMICPRQKDDARKPQVHRSASRPADLRVLWQLIFVNFNCGVFSRRETYFWSMDATGIASRYPQRCFKFVLLR